MRGDDEKSIPVLLSQGGLEESGRFYIKRIMGDDIFTKEYLLQKKGKKQKEDN